jgi:hypothetical protein
MAEQNRNTVLALVAETTEGTPVAPSSGANFIRAQEDLDVASSFDTLTNAELSGSLGQAQPILGLENPSATFSHYLRHSGTEGQAPNYKHLLRAAFGTEVVAGTQYTTASSSTQSVIKVGSGNGTHFERGQALLIKGTTYSIRPVLSVATDDLNLGFSVASAPSSGVGLGKAILYKPANTGHETLTLWSYRANRGAIEMVAGCRVTQMQVDFTAGQFINTKYKLDGVGYYYNPIEITTSTKYIDFLDDATTRAATVATGVYRSPVELASAIAAAMNGLGSSNTFTCTYSSTAGTFTLTSNGSTLTLKWNTGTNTANSIASKIGFSTAADSSSALTYTGSAISLSAPYTPSYDSALPLAAKDNELLIGTSTDTVNLAASKVSFTLDDTRKGLDDVTAVSGRSGSILNGRKATVQVTAYLSQYDAAKFDKFKNGTNAQFLYNFGTKSGGNWVAGTCGSLFLPTAVITGHKVSSADGVLVLEMTLEAYVDSSGNGEVYLNFL